MWWIFVVLLIMLILVGVVMVAIYASNTPPCDSPKQEKVNTTPLIIHEKAVVVYSGTMYPNMSVQSIGITRGGDYALIHPEQRTTIPFKPTRIMGIYKRIIFSESNGNGVKIYDYPEDHFDLPKDWKMVDVYLFSA